MKREKERREITPEEDYDDGYRPDINTGSAFFLVGVAAALFADTALYYQLFPIAILMFAILTFCVVWLIRERHRKDQSDYDNYRRTRKKISRMEKENGDLKKEIEKLKTNLGLKADKPAKSNIRPGSRQSEQYKLLVGGESHDSRTEDKRTARREKDENLYARF